MSDQQDVSSALGKLNVNAKEFVPSFLSSSASTATATASSSTSAPDPGSSQDTPVSGDVSSSSPPLKLAQETTEIADEWDANDEEDEEGDHLHFFVCFISLINSCFIRGRT